MTVDQLLKAINRPDADDIDRAWAAIVVSQAARGNVSLEDVLAGLNLPNEASAFVTLGLVQQAVLKAWPDPPNFANADETGRSSFVFSGEGKRRRNRPPRGTRP